MGDLLAGNALTPFDVWGGDRPTPHTQQQDDEYRVGMKAMLLAPTLAIYQALLQNQEVPVDALDPGWRRRYRL